MRNRPANNGRGIGHWRSILRQRGKCRQSRYKIFVHATPNAVAAIGEPSSSRVFPKRMPNSRLVVRVQRVGATLARSLLAGV